MIYAKINQDGMLEAASIKDGEQLIGIFEGMKPLEQSSAVLEVTGLQGVETRYEETADEIVASCYVVENHPNKVSDEIRRLKNVLSESDYKIIKCYEASLAGLPAPYDICLVHEERQQMRDRINELECLIAK